MKSQQRGPERNRRNGRKLLSWHQQFARRQPSAINSFKWGALLKADKWNHSAEVRLLSHVADYWALCHLSHFALGSVFRFIFCRCSPVCVTLPVQSTHVTVHACELKDDRVSSAVHFSVSTSLVWVNSNTHAVRAQDRSLKPLLYIIISNTMFKKPAAT